MTRTALVGLLGAIVLASSASAHSPAMCRAACAARNVPDSCRWLAPHPAACVQHALKACEASTVPGTVECPLPPELPVCQANHDCPYGSLCVDLSCQVVACGSQNGFATCTANNRCDGDKCVNAECGAVNANCPRGLHCQPAEGPLASISGTCQPDQPGFTYCASTADCIESGNFNPRCVDGVCGRGRRHGLRRAHPCATDADCFRACQPSPSKVRIPRCDAAGQCVCANCTDDAECDAIASCSNGEPEVCQPSGACFCPPAPTPPTGGGGGDFCLPIGVPQCTPCTTDADCDAASYFGSGTCSHNCNPGGTNPCPAVCG